MTLDINWLAVLVAAVVTFALGGVWYGPMLEKAWRAADGRSEPQPGRQKHPAFVYGLAFVLMLVAATFLASFIGRDPNVPRASALAWRWG